VDVNRVTENGTGEYWRKETPKTMNESINREETKPEARDRKKICKRSKRRREAKLMNWSNYATGGRRDKNTN
jgi:hypothetical protein